MKKLNCRCDNTICMPFLVQSDCAVSPMAEDAQKRASMQDWRSFPYFLTVEVWTTLQSAQCSQLKKVDALVNHVVSMGLRNASGPTQGLIAAVIGRHELDGSRFAALLATVKSVTELTASTGTNRREDLRNSLLATALKTWQA